MTESSGPRRAGAAWEHEVLRAVESLEYGSVEIVGGRNHPVTRVVLDQILQRGRQLLVVFDNQDLEHFRLPTAAREKIQPPEWDACSNASRCESRG